MTAPRDRGLDPDPLTLDGWTGEEPRPVDRDSFIAGVRVGLAARPKRRGCLPWILLAVLLAAWVPAPATSEVSAVLVTASSGPSAASLVPEAGSVSKGGSDYASAIPATGQASSIVAGTATYCAPTPRYCKNWGGNAMLGAVPGYGGHPYWAKVTHAGRSVVVRVVSICVCAPGRVIDLSPRAFSLLARLSLGVIAVTVESGDNVPPATDSE